MRHLLDLQQRIGAVEKTGDALDRAAVVLQPPLRLAGAERGDLDPLASRLHQFGDVALHLRRGAPGVVAPAAEQVQVEAGRMRGVAKHAVQGLHVGMDQGHLMTRGLALRLHAAGDVAGVAAERSVGEQDVHEAGIRKAGLGMTSRWTVGKPERRGSTLLLGIPNPESPTPHRSSKPLSELVFL